MSILNFVSYQVAALRTSDPSMNKKDQLNNAALGLAGETGELVELVKKRNYHGKKAKREDTAEPAPAKTATAKLETTKAKRKR